MSRRDLTVDLGDRSYPIAIGEALLETLGPRLVETFQGPRRVVVVTDSGVSPLYLEPVRRSLAEAGHAVSTIQIPAGEQHKNLAWLALVYDRLLDVPVDRASVLVALGGGVVGDLSGFAAATVLRGIAFVQVPTTLLAQVDASVGGKTGINHASGKNLIGAFHQPRLVLIDPSTLRTLPAREYNAGLAEVVKYGAVLDRELFEQVESSVPALSRRDAQALTEIIARCLEIKADVVQRDEREGGWRAILNFGHTVGHAVESLTEYRRFLHGEAVAIGMVAAARVSERLGRLPSGDGTRVKRLLERLDLPVEIPADLVTEQISIAIEADKKASGGRIRFVVATGLGSGDFENLSAKEIARIARKRRSSG